MYSFLVKVFCLMLLVSEFCCAWALINMVVCNLCLSVYLASQSTLKEYLLHELVVILLSDFLYFLLVLFILFASFTLFHLFCRLKCR